MHSLTLLSLLSVTSGTLAAPFSSGRFGGDHLEDDRGNTWRGGRNSHDGWSGERRRGNGRSGGWGGHGGHGNGTPGADPTVTISQGTVIGTATRLQNQPSETRLVNAYLGVPFAAKPVRFSPPAQATAFSGPFQAKTQPPVCLQQDGNAPDQQQAKHYFDNPIENPALAESEDCLYLNIFTPAGSCRSSGGKAVLFWLYGGDLASGGASLVLYNGSSLAVTQDVIVVVPNYRTNIFGFPSSPELASGQQNLGFLDQRFALQWVQDNIAQFGGDPTKVTLFGQSSGGFAVKQLLAQPPQPLPFHAAIMESGAQTTGEGLTSYQTVIDHFGCSTASSPLQCLADPSIAGTDIQEFLQSQTSIHFPPVLDSTNMNHNTKPSIDSGEFADVPIFVGNNKDEGAIFLQILGVTPSNTPPLSEALNGVLPAGLPANVTQKIISVYSHMNGNSTFDIMKHLITDVTYTCPNSILSDYLASKGRQPVWRYRYEPGFPNVDYGLPYLGAYHTTEVYEAMGSYPLANQYGQATPTQIALSSFMQGVWANFAKNPSSGPGWPQLRSNRGVELGVLGGKNKPTGEHTVGLWNADYPCRAVLDAIILAAGNGY